MALKPIHSILIVSFIVSLFATLNPVNGVHALGSYPYASDLPEAEALVAQVTNGQSGELRGIYIPDILAAPVVQQPAGDHGFVSPRQNIVTQFGLASQFGSIGLLAHNYLAGEGFSSLKKGQTFYLIYEDGEVSTFVITGILSFRALEPESTSSQFVDLAGGSLLTTAELFSEVYDRPGNVILQTCISRENNLSWGRLFIIAEPYLSNP
jgi:hypothetical protein